MKDVLVLGQHPGDVTHHFTGYETSEMISSLYSLLYSGSQHHLTRIFTNKTYYK